MVVTASHPATVSAAPLAEIATLTINPTCHTPTSSDSDQVPVTIHGSGFAAGQTVALYSFKQPVGSIGVASNGTFDTSVTVLVSRSSPTDITAYYAGATPDVGGQPVSTAFVAVPCPSPTITVGPPDCGDPGVEIDVPIFGTGFATNVPLTIVIGNSSGTYASTTFTPVDGNNVAVTLPVTLPGLGVYTVQATQEALETPGPVILELLGSPAIAYLVVPCSQLTVAPNCISTPQSPFALLLSGVLFQPNLNVNIVFDPTGQPQYFGPVVADANGQWGAEIDPYARGPGTYDVIATQSIDGPIFHVTHATMMLTIMDGPCPSGTLTPNPNCADPLLNPDQPHAFAMSVHGTGFQPGTQLTLTFDTADQAGPNFAPETTGPVPVATDGSADWSFPAGVAARPVGSYQITANDQTGTVVGQVGFRMPCEDPNPKITSVKPNCGDDVNAQPPPGPYSIRILGKGFIPGPAQIVFDATGSPEAPVTTVVGPNGRLDATINPPARPPNTYHSYVEQSDALRIQFQIPFDFVGAVQSNSDADLDDHAGRGRARLRRTGDGDGLPGRQARRAVLEHGDRRRDTDRGDCGRRRLIHAPGAHLRPRLRGAARDDGRNHGQSQRFSRCHRDPAGQRRSRVAAVADRGRRQPARSTAADPAPLALQGDRQLGRRGGP